MSLLFGVFSVSVSAIMSCFVEYCLWLYYSGAINNSVFVVLNSSLFLL